MVSEVEFRKMCWRSRRGMLELDVLLIPFSEGGLRQLSEEDQRTYVRLLDREDPQLQQWFSRQATPADTEMARVVELILGWIKGES
ncbi:MAG: succinate dehydrogenase assembly factor 2 [Pseudomonadales bacterium]|nr:succinate dehydrogenase assembly factor 2 [Pseudomonadales bacterium]